MATSCRQDLTILHFNDVYQLEPRETEPVGGADRFIGKVRSYDSLEPVILFSGDLFSPSNVSTVTRGKHMVPIINLVGVHAAVFGNHDFDFGLQTAREKDVDRVTGANAMRLRQLSNLENLAPACNFPWLMSNAWDQETEEPLGQGLRTLVIERRGWKIGLIGLIEHEWLETLSSVPISQVKWRDFVTVGRELALQLRHAQGVDLVFALTHMRWPNDERLARDVPEIDLILGGHDHDFGTRLVHRTWVVKSGTDFRDLSRISISKKQAALQAQVPWSERPPLELAMDHVMITSDCPPDEEAHKLVSFHIDRLSERMSKSFDDAKLRGVTLLSGHFVPVGGPAMFDAQVLCGLAVPLDARFSEIRTRETNASNWVADVMLTWLKADVIILNAGSLRADDIIQAGSFTMRDLVRLLPMQDEVVWDPKESKAVYGTIWGQPWSLQITIHAVTGAQLLAALENGVSQYPKMEGRFPCVAGVRFSFNPSWPPMSRIPIDSVTVQGSSLDLSRLYRLGTKEYLATGKDGYTALADSAELVSTEECPTLPVLVRAHLTLLSAAASFMCPNPTVNRALDKFLRPIRNKTPSLASQMRGAATLAAGHSSAVASLTAAVGETALERPPNAVHPTESNPISNPFFDSEPVAPDAGTDADALFGEHEVAQGAPMRSDRPARVVEASAPLSSIAAGHLAETGDDRADSPQPQICLLSSDDEDEGAFPDIAAAHRRQSGALQRGRRQSIVLDRIARRNRLMITAAVDGRITMLTESTTALTAGAGPTPALTLSEAT